MQNLQSMDYKYSFTDDTTCILRSGLQKFICRFCVIIHPVPVPQVTASPIEMKITVKVNQYLYINGGGTFGIYIV